MQKKIILPVLASILILSLGYSQDAFAMTAIVFEEPLDGTIVNGYSQPVADDFILTSPEDITDFHFLAVDNVPNSFDGNVLYAIYDDAGGIPGTLIDSGTGINVVADPPFTCINASIECFHVWVDLPTSVPLGPGTYWLSIEHGGAVWFTAVDNVFLNSQARTFSGAFWQPLGSGSAEFSITGLLTVGGFDVSINTASLLLAGASSVSMWMIPVVIAGAGIGVFVISKRK